MNLFLDKIYALKFSEHLPKILIKNRLHNRPTNETENVCQHLYMYVPAAQV